MVYFDIMKITGLIIFWLFIFGWGFIVVQIGSGLRGWHQTVFGLVMVAIFLLVFVNKDVRDWFERFKK